MSLRNKLLISFLVIVLLVIIITMVSTTIIFNLSNTVARLSQNTNLELTPELQQIESLVNTLLIFTIGAGILLVISAIGLGLGLFNVIIRPLHTLANIAGRLVQGDTNVEIQINSSDEIGTVAQFFNQMIIELRQTAFSQNYIENILQAMGSALIVADNTGRIKTTNTFAQQLLGYSEHELSGRDVSTLFSSLETLRLDAITSRTMMMTSNGESVPVTLSRRKIEANDFVVYNAQDLSQLEKMQKQLLAARSEIEAQSKRANRLYTMMDLMRRQLNNVFEHGASREELRGYMNTLNDEFQKLSLVVSERQ
jgi:PAS domain S-box-containing protein